MRHSVHLSLFTPPNTFFSYKFLSLRTPDPLLLESLSGPACTPKISVSSGLWPLLTPGRLFSSRMQRSRRCPPLRPPESPNHSRRRVLMGSARLLPTYLSEKVETAAGGVKRDYCFPPANENKSAHSSLGSSANRGQALPLQKPTQLLLAFPSTQPPHPQGPGPLLFYVNQVQSWRNGLQVRCGCELYLPRKFVVRIKYEE